MKPLGFVLCVLVFAGQLHGADLKKFVDEMTYFYLSPNKEEFDVLNSQADRYYDELQKPGGRAEVLAGVFIAKASMKHRWRISGTGKASGIAKDIAEGRSNFAKYVNDDTKVDLHKLDIWWSSFFATGDTDYL